MNLTDLIYREKNIFSQDECQFLIDEYNKLEDNEVIEQCHHAATGIMTRSTFKRGVLQPNTEAKKLVFSATEKIINNYMDYLDSFGMFHNAIRGSMLYSHMYRLLKYEKGAKIHPHTDHDPFVYGSCTFNLNDNYSGGDFVFWRGKHRLKLEAGEGLIFPSDHFWVHEVEEVTDGVRYSTNSFLQEVPQPLKQVAIKFVENNLSSEGSRLYSLTEKYNIKKLI